MNSRAHLQRVLRKCLGDHRPGGIDSGREGFLEIERKEYRKKRNLLGTLNKYRQQRKNRSRSPYQPRKTRIKPLRIMLLLSGFLLAMVFFQQNDGWLMIRQTMESLAYFKITQIEVVGQARSEAEAIRSASGIQLSDSIFSINDSPIIASIKDANKWVKEIKLKRIWPAGIEISVTEFKPFALLSTQSETGDLILFYIDRDGYPFIEVTAGMDLDYPVITGVEEIAEPQDLHLRLEAALIFLGKATNPHLPFQQVSELHVDRDRGLTVYMVEYPFPVFFGHGEIRKKYNKLWRVLEVLYKPRKQGMKIARVAYIKLDYLEGRVIVGYSEPG